MLSLHEVSSSYGDINILKGINLSVRRKEIMTIVGFNGAGKSTLINVISGLVRCASGRDLLYGRKDRQARAS